MEVVFKAPDGDDDEVSASAPLLSLPSGGRATSSDEERELWEAEGPHSGVRGTLLDGIANVRRVTYAAAFITLALEYTDTSDGQLDPRGWNHRSTLRCRQSRIRDGYIPPHRPGWSDGLDDTTSRPERKVVRKGIIHGGNAPLFWTLGISGSLVLSVRLCFWRVSPPLPHTVVLC